MAGKISVEMQDSEYPYPFFFFFFSIRKASFKRLQTFTWNIALLENADFIKLFAGM